MLQSLNSSIQRLVCIWVRLADGAFETVVCNKLWTFGFKTNGQIQIIELLIDDAYLSKFVQDMNWWFTRLEILDLIYNLFCTSTNILGYYSTSSQFCRYLALQTSAWSTAILHCILHKHTIGKKAMVMFSQHKYWGTFCLGLLITLTSAATAPIIATLLVGHVTPLLWWKLHYDRYCPILIFAL